MYLAATTSSTITAYYREDVLKGIERVRFFTIHSLCTEAIFLSNAIISTNY